MRLGIKRKILLVLVGSLVLTTTLHALLASYFTDRQNEDSAFAVLRLELLAWQSELQETTQQLKDSALAAVGDGALLNQLAELLVLELDHDDALTTDVSRQSERTLGYLKSVSINRLHLVLRTSDFSSISVFMQDALSHHVSANEAGMTLRRNGSSVWLSASSDPTGSLPIGAWPAWKESSQSPAYAPLATDRPRVSFDYSDPRHVVIEVAVPVQGIVEEVLTDSDVQPMRRSVSDMAVAAGNGGAAGNGIGIAAPELDRRPVPAIFAVVVFRKLIGPAELQKVAARTGQLPVLFSPTGTHRQQITDLSLPIGDMARALGTPSAEPAPQAWDGIVTDERGSYYAALLTWMFEEHPALVLGLATSRDATLQNIRQTVAAILSATALILLLSLIAGILLMGRLINPVVALTNAVKAIGLQGRGGGTTRKSGDRPAPEWLRPVEIDAPDEVGELTRAFNVMIGELRSDLETLEQRVEGRTAELRQQTRYLRTLIDTLPLFAWLKDTEGRYLAANEATARACGRAIRDVVGKTDFELWPREIAEAYRADDLSVMASKQRTSGEEAFADVNGTIWIETFRAPMLDEDGTVLGTAGAARDISERKAAEAAREAALTEAERLAQLRSEFLAQMSHELRTPLNGILGYAQILLRDANLDRRQIEGLKVIQQSGEHLLMLINDVLDLARLEAGRVDLYPDDLALEPVLHVISDIVRLKAEEKGLAFHCVLAPDLPEYVRVDEKRLRQVLLNLLANAIKFTDRGEVTFSVSLVAPSRLRFEVRDTGIGIAENQWEAIFQPFEQAGDAQRRIGGTGLGLAISRQFVHLMGGDIHLTSRVGEGSTFWFELELPIVHAEPPAAPADIRVSGYDGPRKTVLVVDDLTENRRLLHDMLAPLGFILIEAADGREALEKATSAHPDLILMDTVMPGMDGLEATRSLRGVTRPTHLPIIVTSASASGNDARSSLTAGADAFLPKPISMETLLNLLGALLKLQWIYAPPIASAPEALASGPLVPPPLAELTALHELALQGNMSEIRRRAEHIAGLDPRYQAFAERLRRLAEGFQSKALLRLVEHYLDGRPVP